MGTNVPFQHRETCYSLKKCVSQKRNCPLKIEHPTDTYFLDINSVSHIMEATADPSCRCRTSYIPAAMLIRTVPRPTTFPVSKLAICASPTECTASVGDRSSAPGGYTKVPSSCSTIAPGIWLSIACLSVVFKIRTCVKFAITSVYHVEDQIVAARGNIRRSRFRRNLPVRSSNACLSWRKSVLLDRNNTVNT